MSEFFLELFSEEIPAVLQKNLREKLLKEFQNFFFEKSIKSKKSFSLSTPNRLIVMFEGLDKEIKLPSEKIRGPKIEAPEQALEGFIRSNKIKSLFGVEKDKSLLNLIFFFSKKSLKFCKRLLRAFFCKLAGISSLNSSKKNSDIFKIG